MSENITTKLPENADIMIDKENQCGFFTIKNHKIDCRWFHSLDHSISYGGSERYTKISKLEDHGISFETVINETVKEFEHCLDTDENIFHICRMLTGWLSGPETAHCTWDIVPPFDADLKKLLKTPEGKFVIDKFIKMLKDCDNWKDLCIGFHRDNKFRNDLKSEIIDAMPGMQEWRDRVINIKGQKTVQKMIDDGKIKGVWTQFDSHSEE